MKNELSGQKQRELIGKLRFHRLRMIELLSPFDKDYKNFLMNMATMDGDGAPCVYDPAQLCKEKVND